MLILLSFSDANSTAEEIWLRVKSVRNMNFDQLKSASPVTVAERSKACTVFAPSEAEIMGSNPPQGMDALYLYVFVLTCV
jgi:hypothetical protein